MPSLIRVILLIKHLRNLQRQNCIFKLICSPLKQYLQNKKPIFFQYRLTAGKELIHKFMANVFYHLTEKCSHVLVKTFWSVTKGSSWYLVGEKYSPRYDSVIFVVRRQLAVVTQKEVDPLLLWIYSNNRKLFAIIKFLKFLKFDTWSPASFTFFSANLSCSSDRVMPVYLQPVCLTTSIAKVPQPQPISRTSWFSSILAC